MSNPQDHGAFVPTTFIWDVDKIQSMDVTSPEFKELLVRLYQNLNLVVNVLNIKDTGLYFIDEFVCGQQYLPDPTLSSPSERNSAPRQIYRKVIDFGSLPNTGSTLVAHGLTLNSSAQFTRIYATASDTTTPFNYIPIPFASPTLVNNIELSVDATNVTITTGSDRTNFNQCYVVLEYFKF